MTPRAALDLGLAELGMSLPEEARAQLMRYVALLEKWNRTYNLTAIDDPLRMVSHHLLDSLVVVPHLPMPGEARLADAGSGAGLPGIPLAVARPQWRVVLAEVSEKKTAFLRQAALELGLRNVEVHQGRVEQWQPAQRFAVVISRAFAELARFIAACRHLVAPGGVLAAMKGAPPADLGSDCRLISLRVPQLDAQRHLVLCPASSP
ncbi:MAG TPA: 16S rRNA (guanine(527)-N(7))-methyltransferase RsmG [Burkholderiales bacterium]|nr:16S rRNA (guanine(527)-N(7))-methyltransferase RsmG [Burkholderiales bacterium]